MTTLDPSQKELLPEPEKVTLRAAICLYCGHNTPYIADDEKSQAEAWAGLLEHDLTCEKNPLVARIMALEAQVNAQRYAGCIYCGHQVFVDCTDPDGMAKASAQMKDHHQNCQENPLVKKVKILEAELWDAHRGM